MINPIKYIDKKTKAKIRIFYLKVPKPFYDEMLKYCNDEFENDKEYITFLNIKSKYYNLISIEKTEIDFYLELKFTFEKLTNKKSLL
jgi:hypothetical protein